VVGPEKNLIKSACIPCSGIN